MSGLEPHLGPNAPMTAHVVRERVAAPVGEVSPRSQKRIVFRYWFAAIAIGVIAWVGIAYGLGFF